MVEKKVVNGKLTNNTTADEAECVAKEEKWGSEASEREVKEKKEKRKNEYGSWQDQLDKIWHDINTNGQLDDTGEWFINIQNVKINNPL